MKNQILYYAIKYHGEWQRITKAIAEHEPWSCVSYQGKYVTIAEDAYPASLRRLRYAPWILFYEGNLQYLQESGIAIVGAREASPYGIGRAIHVTRLLKERYVIISGLARGIDALAHKEALSHRSIAVIGCGLDVVYPKENEMLYQQLRQHHVIVSEYPVGTRPLAFHFPWRNRIIAALSQGVVVVAARKRSGTLLTVNEALELDIPVYCVPHPMDESEGYGCNLLISQGANILVDDEDIEQI